jgi:hypothetical protein
MKNYISIILISILFTSCENPLGEEVFSQLAPNNFFITAGDAEASLIAAYAASQVLGDRRDYLLLAELNTDILIQREGGLRRDAQRIEDFTWDATHPYFQGMWNRYYQTIFRANVVLDRVPEIVMDESRKAQILAEARFIRAFSYMYLFDYFGGVPLIETSEVFIEDRPERATKEQIIKFIEDELNAVSVILPPTQIQYPRVTSHAVLGFLSKFYLNNRKWQKAADAAKKVMDSNLFKLFESNDRSTLFEVKNERNNEFIFVRPNMPVGGNSQNHLAHSAPPGYKFKFPPKTNFAAQYKMLSSFIDTFDPKDQRLNAFIFNYVNIAGKLIVLGKDDVRSFKYIEDPQGVGANSGNDVPLLRYADILLSRAEALNELNGPNKESIDLINMVREVAGVPSINLSSFSSKGLLKDYILAERAREFHTEELRRQDLIRHGKFLERAIQRGKTVFDYHIVYPIPQGEIDKNSNLVQTAGYN